MVMGIKRAWSLPKLSCKAVGGGDLASERAKAGTSLEAQWLGLPAFTAGAPGSIPGQGTKIQHTLQHNPKKNQKAPQMTLRVARVRAPVFPAVWGHAPPHLGAQKREACPSLLTLTPAQLFQGS